MSDMQTLKKLLLDEAAREGGLARVETVHANTHCGHNSAALRISRPSCGCATVSSGPNGDVRADHRTGAEDRASTRYIRVGPATEDYEYERPHERPAEGRGAGLQLRNSRPNRRWCP